MSFLVLVVGPRKAGKDTVVGGARVQLRGDSAFRFLRSADQLFSMPLERDFAAGRIVVVTVSPAAIPRVRAFHSPVAVVSISAPEDILAWRRAAEGDVGLERNRTDPGQPTAVFRGGPDEYVIDNKGRPDAAIRQLVRILKRLAARAALTDGGLPALPAMPSSAA